MTKMILRMKNLTKNNIELLQLPGLSRSCNISHFITTRHGGVSSDNYGSMNPGLYTNDDPTAIKRNREILAEAINLPVEKIITPHQVHKDEILVLDNDFFKLSEESQILKLNGIDALITNLPQICVTISTADCVPVLLYAADKQVVAAIHAGWRGTVLQIVRKTIQCMKDRFLCNPLQIHAVIGPSISQEAFEVGNEVVEEFRNSNAWLEKDIESLFWKNPISNKTHIDLWKANEFQLLYEGIPIEQTENAKICTFKNYTDYFSARKLGINSGRILSGIFIH